MSCLPCGEWRKGFDVLRGAGKTIGGIVIAAVLMMGYLPQAGAENDTAVEEILGGFEDASPSEAGEEETESEILEGFDDDGDAESAMETDYSPFGTSIASLDGYIKTAAAYNFAHDAPAPNETDWRGLSKLRTELQIELSFDPEPDWEVLVSGRGFYDVVYIINGRDDFTPEVLDENESEFELKDTFIQGRLTRNLDIKLGRQIVVWGKSDNIRITDVLNPLDLREPGLTDIENLRLPTVMSRIDYYFGDYSLTGIGIHEIRFNKTPASGSDFDPLPGSRPPEEKPESGLENTEYAVALNGIFSGWDMALYWADIYNDAARPEQVATAPAPSTVLTHDRIWMIGAAVNIALGNWLLKTEAACFNELKYFATGDEEFSRTDLLAGIEYSGFDETTITLEAADRHIHDFDPSLKKSPDNAKADDVQWVARYTRDFWNDTLTLTLLASTFGIRAENGAFQRLTLEYDITDAVSMLGGAVFYQSGDRLPDSEDNDRLIFEVTWHY